MRRGHIGVRLALLASTMALGLAACGGDDHGGGSSPPTSSTPPPVTTPPVTTPPVTTTMDFEMFGQQQVEQSTCDTSTPASLAVTFTFQPDQDTADPRSLAAVTPGCTM